MTGDVIPPNFRSAEGYRHLSALYDKALANWGVPFETRYVPTRFGQAYSVISGDESSPPLVLLHGAGVSNMMWQSNAAFLSQHFRIYAVDIPNHSGRSDPAKLSRRVSDWTSWLADVLDGLQLDRPNIAGISLGGWLTLQFASALPGRVKRIIPMPPAFLLGMRPGFVLRTIAMMLFPTRRTVHSMLRYFTAPTNPVSDEFVDVMLHIFKSTRFSSSLPAPLTDSILRAITAPTLVMIGDHEVIYNAQRGLERAKRLIPNCETVLVPDSGHGINAEQPGVMYSEMVRFLGS